MPLDVLYEDDSLIVINKQADLVTHPGKANYRGTLAAGLQFHFDQLSDVAGQLRPGIVHRLDRDTTGVILVAKSNQVHHRLSGQFERREVAKEYRAIVRGELSADADVIETFLRVHPKAREKMIVCEPDGKARHAVTRYEVLERFRGFTLVRLLPKTGRTHQLRVHMKHLGCPIVADRLYAGHAQLTLGDLDTEQSGDGADRTLMSRQALHAFRLEFRHPVTDAPLAMEAPVPEDMQRTLEALQRYRSRE
jgi:23S rRNA pseudouridine1911/1915/1917 synthase